MISRVCLVFFMFFSSSVKANQTKNEIHFWMKAFIPKSHPSLPQYIKKTTSGNWVISAPQLPKFMDVKGLSGTCFMTDNRGFSDNAFASARVTVDFIIEIKGRKMNLKKNKGKEFVRIGSTHNVDCNTGLNIKEPKTQSSSSVSIGKIKNRGFSNLFFVKVSSSNPFYGSVSPSIDYSFTFSYNFMSRKITINGSTGYFPSFEAYYSINGEAITSLLKRSPHNDATAMSLIDLNTGFNTINFNAEIDVP